MDDLLNRAFLLACFIHGDRDIALRISTGAMAKLEVATAAQYKRLYYKPNGPSWTGRPGTDRFSSKITFCGPHLLQRLVYLESEIYEKRKERAEGTGKLNDENMLIHFVKHLVKITIRRNSFYVTLGISRLLHNYTTAETMEVYNAVIQDPERVKDDYYYRSRKAVLLQEIKDRFGDLVQIQRGPRGEQKLQADEDSDRFSGLVKECLTFFTPWKTPCVALAGDNPIYDGVNSLSSREHRSEDEVEVDRIHAVLHPDCYGRLLEALGLDRPDHRLGVPRFFLSTNGKNGAGPGEKSDHRHPQKLNDDELSSIKSSLDRQAARRKTASAGLLRIKVDGTEKAVFDLRRSSRISLALDRNAEVMEVSTEDSGGELLLATHIFAQHGPEVAVQTETAGVVLEAGQNLSVVASPSKDKACLMVEIAYRETNPLRALSLYVRQIANRLRTHRRGETTWRQPRVLVPVLSLAILLASAMGIRQYLKQKQSTSQPNSDVARSEPTRLVNPEGPVLPQSANSAVNPRRRQGSEVPAAKQPSVRARPKAEGSDDSRPTNESVPNSDEAATDATRGFTTNLPGRSLRDAKTIYIETLGDALLVREVRQMLIEKLVAGKRFTPTQNRDNADALLRIWVKAAGTGSARNQTREAEQLPATASRTGKVSENVFLTSRLINANGDTIWPLMGTAAQYAGAVEKVTSRIAEELLADSQKRLVDSQKR